ncbi:ATP-binding cassette sub-family G member 5-like [Centruroides sculpturatus]|uniref:ATP-binding cassette sub-family G member 5-like n=1 Tax=Centruroides sculpturatus TaxID=218467 RepID=UPI000C6D4ECB|nr:ATP-binding cassette sub-family G member 5-like [Centruroides sculpturatus]
MIASDHVFELVDVTYTGHVEPGSFLQKLIGTQPTGIILHNITLELHTGELMAILGSTGSGKRSLLDVITCRAKGTTRGQVLLNDAPLRKEIFREQCAYIPKRADLLPGLTVKQTLEYSSQLTVSSKVSKSVRRNRVKEVLADLALNSVSNREISTLASSEYKRTVIGVELVRDPVLLVLEDPTQNQDPLNAYFIMSILSNHVKKYHRMIILTLEKPRSDIFPFLDRVTYLCFGEIVYTVIEKVIAIYEVIEKERLFWMVCLSTVDRQTRERFISSSCQIASLVEKFKNEGAQFRKYAHPPAEMTDHTTTKYKLPLTAYGSPSSYQVLFALIRRSYASVLSCNSRSLREAFVRLLILPLFFSFLFLFYFPIDSYQHSFVTRNGLVFNCLTAVTFLSAAITAVGYAPHRNRYYQETRNDMYNGSLFILSQIMYSFILSGISIWASGSIIYFLARMRQDLIRWSKFCAVLWTVYIFTENFTMSLMVFIKNSYTSFVTSIYILLLQITLGSGTVRSLSSLPDMLYYLSYGIIYRYAGAFLNYNEFADHPQLDHAPYFNGSDRVPCPNNNNIPGRCLYLNGTHYLSQRYHINSSFYGNDLNFELNFIICFVFACGMWIANVVLYLLPVPLSIKEKFCN